MEKNNEEHRYILKGGRKIQPTLLCFFPLRRQAVSYCAYLLRPDNSSQAEKLLPQTVHIVQGNKPTVFILNSVFTYHK